MLISISQVLDADQRELLSGMLDALVWKDGAETAGRVAAQVKRNQQADLNQSIGLKVEQILFDAITAHPVLRAAAQPNKFSSILVSKTTEGGGYGMHVDNPFMRTRGTGEGELRTDLSFTLFLSPPETYEGGELVIEHAGQTQSLKPRAGDLVLYPSSSLHQVSEVTSGERLVCVGWIESRVRRVEDRETLFDLINLKAELASRLDDQSPEMLTLSKVIANLKRRF
ncbi:MAG: Fe2+-dependent dioxygenase [Alphaproteobacteria bacterium]|nr:Fe2+-dependent dioxygenase [Alphaproteobacteria bacterium]